MLYDKKSTRIDKDIEGYITNFFHDKTCILCGDSFKGFFRTKGKFCSKRCANDYYIAKRRDKMAQKRAHAAACVICTTPITQLGGKIKAYCSNACKQKAYRRRRYMSTLQEYILQSNNIVFFGGAGVSTESGIPDFRSVDGLYNQTWKYPPEVMLSYDFFANKTKEFFDFYKNKLLHLNAEPNKAHLALAALEKSGKLKAVITQNIDGLHQKAGSKNVLELHGSIWRNYCLDCGGAYTVKAVVNADDVPLCNCGGVIRPDVVLYDESLDYDLMINAMDYIAKADMLIIGGTSLGVYPAAGLLEVFKGKCLVLINKSSTHMDDMADLVIRDNIGVALSGFVHIEGH